MQDAARASLPLVPTFQTTTPRLFLRNFHFRAPREHGTIILLFGLLIFHFFRSLLLDRDLATVGFERSMKRNRYDPRSDRGRCKNTRSSVRAAYTYRENPIRFYRCVLTGVRAARTASKARDR